jgi:hypothetical protein
MHFGTRAIHISRRFDITFNNHLHLASYLKEPILLKIVYWSNINLFILRGGTRWRIRNGTNISLLNENWLCDASSLSVQDTKVSLMATLTVADVIMPDEKNWNLPLLSSMFEHNSVQKIIKTPLYDSVTEDKHIWHKEKDGVYKKSWILHI